MSWLGLVQALLSFVSALTGYLRDRQLIASGEARHALESLEAANERLDRALAARRLVRARHDSGRGLHDNADPDRRD